MEDFVTFEIAKKLKEKGFKEECVAHYYSNDPTCRIKNTALADYIHQPFCIESIKRSWNRCELNPCSSGCYYDVPTISQVLKWLRDLLEIDILPKIVISYCDNLNRIRSYSCSIYSPRLNKPIETEYFESYEEATLAGIEYVLDNFDKL